MGHSIFYPYPRSPTGDMIPTDRFISEVRFPQFPFASKVTFREALYTMKLDSDSDSDPSTGAEIPDSDRVLLDIRKKNGMS